MADFVMQVRRGRRTGAAGVAQQLAALDVIAYLDFDTVQMAVDG